jgi:hypothetical protein
MISVETSLRRLQNNFSGLVPRFTSLRDVSALKEQIELRCRVLQDIAVIRNRLGTFLRRDKKLARRRSRSRVGRTRLAETFRAGRIRCQV